MLMLKDAMSPEARRSSDVPGASPGATSQSDDGIGKRTLVAQILVQRRARTAGLGPTTEDVEAAAVHGMRGGGGELPRRDVQLKGGVGVVGDPYERHADAVADAVLAGRSAEPLLDASPGGARGGTPAVQRDAGSDPAKERQQRQGSNIERLVDLLHQPSTLPWGWEIGYAFLGELGMTDLLTAIGGAADRGYLPQLDARARTYAGAPYLRARLLAAVHVIELASAAPVGVSNPRLHQAGLELDRLSQSDQLQVIEFLLARRGVSIAPTILMEGVLAMREQQAAGPDQATVAATNGGASGHGAAGPATAGGAGVTAPPTPIEPGPWTPPGDQPIPFYIGNEAHKGIATEYVAAHVGDRVMTNFSPISSILAALRTIGQNPNPDALTETDRGLMPDITNLTRLHVYEIKPLAAQALGAAKATLCVGLFGRAGVAMQLGPTSEPGTQGGLPAPGGVYMFWSPEPGVIVYQYRRGRLVPVPVPEPEPATERRWRFELQPMTPQQRQAVATFTVGTALLLAAMILLSPVGI
jgi:hypothetical protein